MPECPRANQNTMVLGTVAALGIAAVALLVFGGRKLRLKRRCEGFVRAGEVAELYIYPIKSCAGNKVDWLDCGERGSTHGADQDRHFLVVDSLNDNLFMTARIYPRMVLIRAHVQADAQLHVEFPEGSSVQVDLNEVEARNEVRRTSLWEGLRVEGLDCGDAVAHALDVFLDVKGKRALRLIYFAGERMFTERDQHSEQRYWLNNAVPELQDKIAYADLASYMGFARASVDHLNARLPCERGVDARNFRPNLVVAGAPAFDEDSWLHVRAGEAEFACYKPCTRCVLTTVNPDSGVKDSKMEPLKELRKYRLAPGKLYELFKESPVFGVNMAIVKPGRVRVGDPVWVQYKPSPF